MEKKNINVYILVKNILQVIWKTTLNLNAQQRQSNITAERMHLISHQMHYHSNGKEYKNNNSSRKFTPITHFQSCHHWESRSWQLASFWSPADHHLHNQEPHQPSRHREVWKCPVPLPSQQEYHWFLLLLNLNRKQDHVETVLYYIVKTQTTIAWLHSALHMYAGTFVR